MPKTGRGRGRNKGRLGVQAVSSDGLGGGTWNLNGDYSSTPLEVSLDPIASADNWVCQRIIVQVVDAPTITATGFGAGSALANGVKIEVRDLDDNVITDMTPQPIKQNADWGRYCYDTQVSDWGAGAEVLHARWTLARMHEGGYSFGFNEEKLVVVLSDNLTHLTEFTLFAEGYIA